MQSIMKSYKEMIMMKETKLAKELLNAVWEEDSARLEEVLLMGANPSWVFNGYPILLHAIYLHNKEIAMQLIRAGATQVSEGLGFALEQGIGEMVWPLAFLGVIPKAIHTNNKFGMYPSRFAPTCVAYA